MKWVKLPPWELGPCWKDTCTGESSRLLGSSGVPWARSVSPKLVGTHLAPALDEPGVVCTWIGNEGWPLRQRDALAPHERSDIRARLLASPAKDMDAIAPHTAACVFDRGDPTVHASACSRVQACCLSRKYASAACRRTCAALLRASLERRPPLRCNCSYAASRRACRACGSRLLRKRCLM